MFSSILITGAASGLGKALALEFSRRGSASTRMFLIDRDEKGLALVKDEIKEARVEVFVCDLASKEELARVFSEQIFHEIGDQGLDVLINCAGITYVGAFEDMDLDDFEKVISVNLMGAVRVTRLALEMMKHNRRPSVVNISSLAGLVGAPNMVAYSASKFGLMGFTESLRAELGDRVHFLSVAPSFIDTAIAKNSLHETQASESGKNKKIARMEKILKRFGKSPEKAARLIIEALEKRKNQLVMNPDAQVLCALKRFMPEGCQSLVRLGFRQLKRSGIVSS